MEPAQPCSRTIAHDVLDAIFDAAVLAARDFYDDRLIECLPAHRKYLYGLFDCGLPFDKERPPIVRIMWAGRGVQIEWPDRHIILSHAYQDPTRWVVYNVSPGNQITSTPMYLPRQMDALLAEFRAN